MPVVLGGVNLGGFNAGLYGHSAQPRRESGFGLYLRPSTQGRKALKPRIELAKTSGQPLQLHPDYTEASLSPVKLVPLFQLFKSRIELCKFRVRFANGLRRSACKRLFRRKSL